MSDNPADTEDEVGVSDEEALTWVYENPDLASEFLAMGLDVAADRLGRSQEARLARTLATDAWKLHLLILGLDELHYREAESQEE